MRFAVLMFSGIAAVCVAPVWLVIWGCDYSHVASLAAAAHFVAPWACIALAFAAMNRAERYL